MIARHRDEVCEFFRDLKEYVEGMRDPRALRSPGFFFRGYAPPRCDVCRNRLPLSTPERVTTCADCLLARRVARQMVAPQLVEEVE